MIETRIARRYLWASRKQAHTAFLSLISMLGLAVGVATLLISLALLSGLQGQIKERLIASSPQILVEPSGTNSIADAGAIAAAGQRLGMTRVHQVVSGIGWGARSEGGGRPMRIRSYEPGDEPERIGREWKPADASEPRIFLTRDFAAALGLTLGDLVTVVAPRTTLTPFGPVPVWRKYRIVRLAAPSGEDRAADAWLDLGEAESFFNTDGNPTSIEMYGDPALADGVQSALRNAFSNVVVKTWKEINRPLFLALRLEKIVMFVTISLIIFVAALNLISSLSMLIMEKRPQVGVLRTMGATERNIRSVFLQVGLFIGLTGTLLGNCIGLGFSFAANRFHLVPLPSRIYFISYLPFRVEMEDVIGVNIVAIVLAILSTWYPARVAARMDPIAAIREEA
jgi:lipoprotein-releasing system permease protein